MGVRMRMHVLICVFSAVLLMAHPSAGDAKPTKRFKTWLQTRMKRDLHPEPQQNPELDHMVPLRSPRSPSGCLLPTCAYNDLIHMLHLTLDPPKLSPAPKKKLGPDGFGRRRRRHSPLDVTRVGQGEA